MITWRADRGALDLAFAADVEALLTASPWAWWVISGRRTLAEQTRLWQVYQAGGPRAAPPGRSAHNYGLAVDLALDMDPLALGLQPSWKVAKSRGWLWLRDAAAAHPRLASGWRYGDWPHLERVRWTQQITAAQAA